jgi:cbb3-type cytochrome oxidase subunit 3
VSQPKGKSMIKVIQSQDPAIKPKTIGYIRDMSQYKLLRILLRILLLVCFVTIPLLIIWFAYEKITKKSYLSGRYLILSKNKYSLDDSTIKLEELNSEDGNTLLGTVAGGVLFGGIGALGGAILGSRKSGVFVLTDQNNQKTLIEAKGTGIVKQLRELSLIGKAFT